MKNKQNKEKKKGSLQLKTRFHNSRYNLNVKEPKTSLMPVKQKDKLRPSAIKIENQKPYNFLEEQKSATVKKNLFVSPLPIFDPKSPIMDPKSLHQQFFNEISEKNEDSARSKNKTISVSFMDSK